MTTVAVIGAGDGGLAVAGHLDVLVRNLIGASVTLAPR